MPSQRPEGRRKTGVHASSFRTAATHVCASVAVQKAHFKTSPVTRLASSLPPSLLLGSHDGLDPGRLHDRRPLG